MGGRGGDFYFLKNVLFCLFFVFFFFLFFFCQKNSLSAFDRH